VLCYGPTRKWVCSTTFLSTLSLVTSSSQAIAQSPPDRSAVAPWPNFGFGIGCFGFENRSACPTGADDPYSPSQYRADIEKALNSIPSINNLAVRDFNGQRISSLIDWDLGPEATADTQHLCTPIFRPHFSSGDISFSVTIPRRIHHDLLHFKNELADETFPVRIVSTSQFPVVFIRTNDPLRGADAIQLTREFLWQELASHKGEPGDLTLAVVGPSPMHVDCLVISAPTGEGFSGVEPIRVKVPGYHKILFKCDPEKFPTQESAFNYLTSSLADELGLYYNLVNLGSLQIQRLARIHLQLTQLVDLSNARGVGATLRRVVNLGRESRRLVFSILSFESDLAEDQGYFQRIVNKHYEEHRVDAFRDYLDTELADLQNIRTRNTVEVAKLLESRQNRDLQLLALTVAPLLGGIVGAAITAAITHH
jgi:hypothetical protein